MSGDMNIRISPDSTGPVEITIKGGHLVLGGVVSFDREAHFDGTVTLDGALTHTVPVSDPVVQETFAQVKAASDADTVFVTVPMDAPHHFWTELADMIRAETDKAHNEGRRFRCILLRGSDVTLASEAAQLLTRAEMIGLYNGMKEDARTILANVEPGDHGDAILEAFGRRVIEATMQRLHRIGELA
ncbi:hypothetical protein [Paraburkholderia sp. C35]|uniref:hypothetical protein n=1 Tax=Paraburkholderia sp. C35 TaxID=2126993 RepID=UPI000D6914C5|nr:hypothetical protein [Paraburkholderia sp. C35]